MSAQPGYSLPVVTADFRDRMGSEFHHGSIKCHPERRLPERRIYAQRFDFAAPSNRKPLRVDPSTAHGAGAPRLLRMTFQPSECVQTSFSFRKSTVSILGASQAPAGAPHRMRNAGPAYEARERGSCHRQFLERGRGRGYTLRSLIHVSHSATGIFRKSAQEYSRLRRIPDGQAAAVAGATIAS